MCCGDLEGVVERIKGSMQASRKSHVNALGRISTFRNK